jgi:electron-transferring-flavoprotein dehydrogenase
LKGGRVIEAGAKTIPEGGFYSMPKAYAPGALLVGDTAGLVNMKKIKGWHLSILSGISAAETAFLALEKNDVSGETLEIYRQKLEANNVLKEMHGARNYRQAFGLGLYIGGPLAIMSSLLPRMRISKDYEKMQSKKLIVASAVPGETDRMAFVGLSGTMHSEDQPSHIEIIDPDACAICFTNYDEAPCESFCPGGVYRKEEDKIMLSPSNCLHDQSCTIKCPIQNILWKVPEGGDGPRYKNL